MLSEHELKPDEKAYIAIGRFVFQFSQLEYSFRYYLAEHIGLKDEYWNAIISYDFAMLCTIFESVFSRTLHDDAGAKLKTLINKCRELNADRIRVVHGLWVIGKEGGRLHHVARTSLQSSTHFEQAEQLNAKADLACNLRAELERIVYATPEGLFRNRQQAQ